MVSEQMGDNTLLIETNPASYSELGNLDGYNATESV